jgi:hypothetical protein
VGNPQLSRTYVPPSSAARSQCPFHKNANSAELTRQLKGLSSEDLRNQVKGGTGQKMARGDAFEEPSVLIRNGLRRHALHALRGIAQLSRVQQIPKSNSR